MLLPRRILLCAAALPWVVRPAGAEPLPGLLQCPLDESPPILIPGVSNALGTRLVGSNIYRGLCRIAADGTPQPDLAQSQVSNDGLIYRFHLLPGLTWHDSGALTAADVVFSLNRFHRALSPAPWMAQLASIEAHDAQTVTLTLRQPWPGLLRSLDVLHAPIVPQHVHDIPGWGIDPHRTAPVGAGPFRYDGWLRLARFDWFAGPAPAFAELAFPILPDPAARDALLASGKPVLWVTETAAPQETAKLRGNPALALETLYPVEMLYPGQGRVARLLLNPAASPFDRPGMAAALAPAIDRDAVSWATWGGSARASGGPAYNPRTAAAALQAAGLRPGDDGVRARLRLLLPPGDPAQRLAAALTRMLGLVAIDLVADSVDEPSWRRRVAAGEYEIAAALSDPAEPTPPSIIPLAELGCLVVRDRRLHLPEPLYGSFAPITFA